MKLKFKLCFLLLFCFVIFASSVQAVGQVYFSVVKYDDNSPQFVYRSTIRPFSTTELSIIKSGKNYNEWITDGTDVNGPTQQTYFSEYLIFTKEQLATYTNDSDSYYGYYEYAASPDKEYLLTSESITDFENWWSSVKANSQHKKVKVDDKYLYNFQTSGKKTTSASFSIDTFENYMNNILSLGRTGALSSYYVAPGGALKGPNNIPFDSKLVPYVEVRKMLFNEEATKSDLLNVLSSGGATNTLYVSDILVNKDATQGIIEYINEQKEKGNDSSEVYVSAISSTLAWYNSMYMYMLTPENFLHAKSDDIDVANWSGKTLGNSGNGEYSGLNLWDNILKVDTEPQNKTIVINHVLVDKDGNNLNYEKIDRQEAVSLYVDGKSVWDTQNLNYLFDDKSSNYLERYQVSSELTNFYTKNLTELDSNRIWTAENGFELQPGKYEVKGYAVYKGNTTNLGSTSSDIASLIDEAENHAKYEENNLQNTGDFVLGDNENIAVVNIYYTAPTVDIEVRHYCIKNEYGGGFNIVGNGYGTKLDGTKYPFTSTAYGVEYYDNVSIYDTITFERKNNLEGIYEYLGYDFNKDYSAEEADNNVDFTDASITVNKDTVTMQDGKIIIIFKYKVGSNLGQTSPNKTLVSNENPKLNINGVLGIESINGPSATCGDTYSVPTNAKDGEEDIYVGIRQIPNYILAGMNVKQLSHEGSSVKINITISFGPNSKTWTIEVPYYLSYYVVENLMMYKFDNATVFNTKIGEDTYGEKLFAGTVNKRTIKPTQTSALTLWGVANNNITNNRSSIDNWKNYLVTSTKMDYKPLVDYSGKTLNSKEDTLEKIYKRNISTPGYYSSNYGVSGLNMNYGSTLDNDIDTYITYKFSNNGDTTTVNNLLLKSYQNITLTKEATITINLLKQSQFIDIDIDNDEIISEDDIIKAQEITDDKLKELSSELRYFKDAYDSYNFGCSSGGYSLPCLDNAYNRYLSEKRACENSVCGSYESCSGEGEEQVCKEIDIYCTCGECGGCSEARGYYNTISSYATYYGNTKNAYNTAKSEAENAYSNEKYALQNFDEAYYIQENLWNNYKNYNAEQIVKLLNLDIKFDYSSGGAKIADTELLTVEKHTVTLDTESSQEKVFGNHGHSISSTGDKLTLNTVSLYAVRQTLTETQKSYYTDGIKTVSWIGEDITLNNYSNNKYLIPRYITGGEKILNGTRRLAATSEYKIDGTINVGGTANSVLDNMYYNSTNTKYGTIYSDVKGYTGGDKAQTTITEYVYNINTANQYKYYGANKKNSDGTINSQLFNIYVPLVVNTDVNQDMAVIDQTTDSINKNVDVIQANSKFTITFDSNYSGTSAKKVYSTSLSDFSERYLNPASYYIKFMFDIDNVKYKTSSGITRSFGTIKADTWIGPIYGDTLEATARINTSQGASVTDSKWAYYVIAVAINAKDSWTKQVIEQIQTSLSDITDTELLKNITNNCGTEGGKKISYYASTVGELVIVNRMYDFRVTDVKDVDWKNVFRLNESSSYVNSHSGIAYYAGLSKWNTEDPTKYNEIVGRSEEEVGSSPTRVLPVGPYKNTNKSYVYAPKMGYRFSFDLKVTGAKDNDKSVEIQPRFYYISKDAKTYYSEYNGSGTGIYLFYKNSNGQYVRVGSTQDKYQIQFVPNDGYRALIQNADINLSKNNIVIGNIRKLVLPFDTTSTYSDNDAAITYYGEYKLPNSTIAVKVENGKYDINKPLSDGYIGVIFDIYAKESNNTVLSYGQNSYIPASKTVAEINTSQWDYEGYLGIIKPGEEYTTKMRLEKGTWQINNTMYNKIKGTVMLYDLDKKASNDFN